MLRQSLMWARACHGPGRLVALCCILGSAPVFDSEQSQERRTAEINSPAEAHGKVVSILSGGELQTPGDSRSPLNLSERRVRAAQVQAVAVRHMGFEMNQGQTDPRVKFLSRGPGYTVFLTSSEAVLSLRKVPAPDQPLPANRSSKPDSRSPQPASSASESDTASPAVLRMRLVGASLAPRVTGSAQLPGKVNYLLGDDPKQWRIGIPTYAQVHYHDVYPGVDLVYHGEQEQLEYDFVVRPKADPNVIALNCLGADRLAIDAQGNLQLQIGGGTVLLHKPTIYQLMRSHRGRLQPIAGGYLLKAGREVGFRVGAYDKSQQLIIDPVLTYSSYLGGSGYDSGNGIAVDSSGSAYVTGFTLSSNFPITSGAYDTACGTAGSCNGGFSDAFVTKFSPGGSSLVYSTYVGGSKDEIGNAIAVDASGSAYVAGQTFSSDFPTTSGAFSTAYAGAGDGFVFELSPDGSSLQYSTYLGGSSTDAAYGVAVNANDNAYVTGGTYSTNFPTLGAIQGSNGGNNETDAFVTELNAVGSGLVYSTYLGGSGSDRGNGIALDSAGNAYVTGFTKSSDFPLASPLQATCSSCPGYADAFVAEISPNGAALAYSTYLGGSSEDQGSGVAVDGGGNIYVTGLTFSTDFPTTTGAYQTTLMGAVSGAFVTEIAPNFASLLYSTYLHGNALDYGQSIAVDSGNVYVAGQTFSTSFPLASAIQTSCRSSNCYYGTGFITELNAAGSGLIFSTYLGGSREDQGTHIALDSSANVYVAGEAGSSDFPTANAFQATFGGSYGDAFASKVGLTPAVSVSPSSLSFASQQMGTTSAPQTVTLTSNGTTPAHISSITTTGDFAQTNNCRNGVAAGSTCTINVTFTPTATGTRTGTLSIADNASGSPQQVSLSGTGTGSAPAVRLSPTGLTFASQNVGTTSAAQTVTLTNTGNATLNIASITITGTNAGDFAQTNTCGTSVGAGANCTISVTFTPTATGSRTASVSIADSASGSPQQVGLSGTATGSAPAVSLSPTSLTFARQTVGTTSPAQNVTLTNTGNATLSISNISITGTNASDFAQTNNCGSSVAAGANCTISVTFTPTATGTRTGSVTIVDNASDSPQQMPLTSTVASATACTKFVSPSGSDSNDGSQNSPWQHLQKAFNSSAAGDVVCLRAGTYPSQSTTTYSQIMNNSGTAASPITIQNYPGEAAVVQGNTRVNGAYVTFKGTALTPPYGLVFQIGTSGLTINGFDVLNTHDVTLDHVEIKNFDYHAAYNQSNGCNNKVLGSYIHDNGVSAGSVSGIAWGSTSSGCANGGLIANNVVENNSSIAIQLYAGGSSTTPSYVTVEENTFVLQGAYGITVWGDKNIVANNIVYGNGDPLKDSQGAIYTGTANVVDHNVTFDAASSSRSGWYLAGGCCLQANQIADPLFVNAGTKDWHLTSSSPAIGYSNISYVQSVDKDGNARGPGYDAGAYQFVH